MNSPIATHDMAGDVIIEHNMTGIYIIRNTINNKCYIGSSLNIVRRLSNHKSLLVRNKHHSYKLQGSYNKHGKENFEFGLLEEVYFPEHYNKSIKLEYLECLEGYYIVKYDSYKKGYNVSEIPRIVGNSNTRKSILKGIQTRRERGSYNISDITRERRSIALRSSLLFREAMRKNGLSRRKPVYQYDINGNFIREWESYQIASKELGIVDSMIRKTIYGERCRCKNFIFSYEKKDRVDSYKDRINSKPPRACRYINMYNSSNELVKVYSDYKECSVDNNLKPSTILSYISKNSLCNGYKIAYGSVHK